MGWQRVTASCKVCRGPVKLSGAVLSHTATANAVLYDGANASGRPVLTLHTHTDVIKTVPVMFPEPITLEDGLYVALSTTVDALLLIYEPQEG